MLAWNHGSLPQEIEAESGDSRQWDFVVGDSVQAEKGTLPTCVAASVADFELTLLIWFWDPELGFVRGVAVQDYVWAEDGLLAVSV